MPSKEYRIPYVNPSKYYRAPSEIPNRIVSNGPKVAEFEERAAEFVGARYAAAVNSGTVALFCAYAASGLKNARMQAYTWRSTAEAAKWAGVEVEYIDVRLSDFQAEAQGSGERVVANETFGSAANYDDYPDDAIFDSASAFGSRKKTERTHCFSLSPTKVLTANEGGLVASPSEQLVDEIKNLRKWAGRMTEFNAACALEGLKTLPAKLEEKAGIAARYRDFCEGHGIGCQRCENVTTNKDFAAVFFCRDFRDAAQSALEESGIETRTYFTPAYRFVGGRKPGLELPNTERLSETVLCLPSWPGVDQDSVIQTLEGFLKCQDSKRHRTRSAIA